MSVRTQCSRSPAPALLSISRRGFQSDMSAAASCKSLNPDRVFVSKVSWMRRGLIEAGSGCRRPAASSGLRTNRIREAHGGRRKPLNDSARLLGRWFHEAGKKLRQDHLNFQALEQI